MIPSDESLDSFLKTWSADVWSSSHCWWSAALISIVYTCALSQRLTKPPYINGHTQDLIIFNPAFLFTPQVNRASMSSSIDPVDDSSS